MKKRILLIGIFFFLFGCKKSESDVEFKYFDYTFNNTFGTCFSIKFAPNGSVYLREHWNAKDVFDSINIPRGETNYIALITKEDKKSFIELISKLQLKKCNLFYEENYSDGRFYSLFIDKDSIKKLISVHSYHNVPKELDSLSKWINSWKSRVKLIKTSKELTFYSSKYVLPPPPPPPLEKIK